MLSMITDMLPSFSRESNSTKSSTCKKVGDAGFALSAIVDLTLIINAFIEKNYWTCAGGAFLLAPLSAGYIAWKSDKTIEELNREYKVLLGNLQKSISPVTENVNKLTQTLSSGNEEFQQLVLSINALAEVIETFQDRVEEDPKSHAQADRVIEALSVDVSRLETELNNV